jgi:methionyl-tRNA formyltransferase
MGTPDFAVPTLEKIIRSRHEVVAVYTRAPKPAGRRGLELQPSPVAREAELCHIPVDTPPTLKGLTAETEMLAHRADIAIVVAYGFVLSTPILNAFPLGCFNLHASLLPRWRGAAPINRAVMAGDDVTGVTVMKMDEGLDTGPMATLIEPTGARLVAARLPIGPTATAGDVHDELARLGAELVLATLDALERQTLWLTPQPEIGATYAYKIEKEETRIDWTRSCREVHDHCRGLSPFPGAWFIFPGVGRVKVLRTAVGHGHGPPGHVIDDRLTIGCGQGSLRLLELQRAGGKPMSADVFLRGTRGSRVNVVH